MNKWAHNDKDVVYERLRHLLLVLRFLRLLVYITVHCACQGLSVNHRWFASSAAQSQSCCLVSAAFIGLRPAVGNLLIFNSIRVDLESSCLTICFCSTTTGVGYTYNHGTLQRPYQCNGFAAASDSPLPPCLLSSKLFG